MSNIPYDALAGGRGKSMGLEVPRGDGGCSIGPNAAGRFLKV